MSRTELLALVIIVYGQAMGHSETTSDDQVKITGTVKAVPLDNFLHLDHFILLV